MLTRSLTRAFQTGIDHASFFADWKKENPREFWDRRADRETGIDLQLDKWWEKSGGKVAVNLWCGHRWSSPPLVPGGNGIELHSLRLCPPDCNDHWWSISKEEDIDTFFREFETLLGSEAVPWFQQVCTKEGFLNWSVDQHPQSPPFHSILDVRGKGGVLEHLGEWLRTAPRGIGHHLQWIASAEIIPEDLAKRLELASIQAEDDYNARLPDLIGEVERLAASPLAGGGD